MEINATETVKLLRADLKKICPKQRLFYIKIFWNDFIKICWKDGPSQVKVDQISNKYIGFLHTASGREPISADGKHYNVKYIFSRRNVSKGYKQSIEHDLFVSIVKPGLDGSLNAALSERGKIDILYTRYIKYIDLTDGYRFKRLAEALEEIKRISEKKE